MINYKPIKGQLLPSIPNGVKQVIKPTRLVVLGKVGADGKGIEQDVTAEDIDGEPVLYGLVEYFVIPAPVQARVLEYGPCIIMTA